MFQKLGAKVKRDKEEKRSMDRRDFRFADIYSAWYEISYDTNKSLIQNLDNRGRYCG